ncbi:hypothetical protein FB567DRAFT_512356 [Paraphoma chrysanthemicola]|uniref:Uncharacterized protein n=1 Tax=Paraphoma chrysanthemicola TaxID=798071 RepID=A0A8K0RLE1_9PLEO|nr:hypothetical protein FB567DRAFT_512356 [Paraphoma chrysanthemicola]
MRLFCLSTPCSRRSNVSLAFKRGLYMSITSPLTSAILKSAIMLLAWGDLVYYPGLPALTHLLYLLPVTLTSQALVLALRTTALWMRELFSAVLRNWKE